MPVKNNLIIYDKIYRHFTMTYGFQDQVRVDGRQEFNLVFHIQEYLRDQRRNPAIDSFKSTNSTDININVNYPIKNGLVLFATDGLIDMTQDHAKFAVSWVSFRVAEVGLQLFTESSFDSPKMTSK